MEKKVTFSSILAIDESGGLGRDGRLAWDYPEDLRRFRTLTSPSSNLIMGRRTYDEIVARLGDKHKAAGVEQGVKWLLSEHRCLHVLSRNPQASSPYENVTFHQSKQSILSCLEKELATCGATARTNFVIGGSDVFMMFKPMTTVAHITLIPGTHQCDIFLPSDYIEGFAYQSGFSSLPGTGPLFQLYTKDFL